MARPSIFQRHKIYENIDLSSQKQQVVKEIRRTLKDRGHGHYPHCEQRLLRLCLVFIAMKLQENIILICLHIGVP